MHSLRHATSLIAEVAASRLASHAAATCSAQCSQSTRALLERFASACPLHARPFAAGVDYSQSPPGMRVLRNLACSEHNNLYYVILLATTPAHTSALTPYRTLLQAE